ncbi:MAG: M13 family metallopeptidase, partial [Acidobacteria bacterium]|nr:M13 family metallopeptidase [Acidobacteriota bacterium]
MRKASALLLFGFTALFAQTGTRFDVSALDKSANPCVDFYQYACGTWMAKHPIPADMSSYGRMTEIAEQNRLLLKDILEKAAAGGSSRSAVEQKIGDYYAACMDEKAIEERGTAPLKPELERIAAIGNRAGLAEELARLHRIGARGLFGFGAGPDMKNANQNIANLFQGGLTLPDRDYYLKEDAKSTALREKYLAHLRAVFGLLGDSPEAAAAKAQVVMELETGMAKISIDRTSLRNPASRYHKMTRQELGSLAPEFDWDRYFAGTGAVAFDSLNVGMPTFMRGLDAMLHEVPLDKWKVYLAWHYAHSQAEMLPVAFVKANFDFFSHTLAGVKEMRPRWKTCVSAVDGDLGEALGQIYVERAFGADGKARTLKMVDALEEALEKDINELPWMTPATKKQALVKLAAVTNKIGYPDKWRDYSTVEVRRDDALGNSIRANEFAYRRNIGKIGKDVDPSEWGMTPPTVNAYYSPLQNNINFPAGILQPPLFDRTMDDAVNFGAIGAVIGHEMTHGFDDQGRKFDPKGNLNG